jgi:hypothetical protein
MRAMADSQSADTGSAAGSRGTGAESVPGTGVVRAAGGQAPAAGAVNGVVTRRDADAIVAEIERTRENLARTIDALADRVSPAYAAQRLRDRARAQAARPEVRLAAAAAGLAVVGIVLLRAWARRRK